MILIVDLLVGAHEVDSPSVLENSSVAVIPLAVELNEVPVVVGSIDRISLDHHVGNSGKVKKHLAARIIDITVSRTF